ncbi:Os09g0313175 [Oryza sativa Japonica Group]|uniref:Os09g0313175 protein n=1 Tax=Oryza sativa subsp. japonica TaxID=39947 RepID=A0A0P0XL61_ORYSJ|nr:Os09g0313175 [Oryza sativa Japonica Group]
MELCSGFLKPKREVDEAPRPGRVAMANKMGGGAASSMAVARRVGLLGVRASKSHRSPSPPRSPSATSAASVAGHWSGSGFETSGGGSSGDGTSGGGSYCNGGCDYCNALSSLGVVV